MSCFLGRRATARPTPLRVKLNPTQVLSVAIEQALGYIPDVPQHVPAIHHLQGVRSDDRRSARILGRTVTHDDLDAHMLLEPRRERPGRAIG